MKLSDRVAIVTGAAQGIGRACAERFVAEGAKVVLADINGPELRRCAAEIGTDETVFARVTDVGARNEVEALVAAAVERFGQLDIMLNNAGLARSQPFLEITEADYDAVMGVNLKGAFFGTQLAARQMIIQGGPGVIINMSSVNARLAIPSLASYAISKGGMNQVTTIAAVALAPHNIRVVGIGPGTISTELATQSVMTSPAARHTVLSRTPLGRMGDPAEVASVAAFLASDDASYITGQTIYVDGGRMVLNYTVPVRE